MERPRFQGSLDGLCGVYAVVNALVLCGATDPDKVFRICCRAVSKSRWPDTIWDGTGIGDIQRMVRACVREGFAKGIDVEYPFLKSQPASDAIFWSEFDQRFKFTNDAVACIFALDKPDPHWIVVDKHLGKRLSFVDSHPTRPIYKANRSSFHAGIRRPRGKSYLVNRRDLAIFFKVDA